MSKIAFLIAVIRLPIQVAPASIGLIVSTNQLSPAPKRSIFLTAEANLAKPLFVNGRIMSFYIGDSNTVAMVAFLLM